MFPFPSKFPFKDMQAFFGSAYTGDIAKYVQDAVSKSVPFPAGMQSLKPDALKELLRTVQTKANDLSKSPPFVISMFETHDDVYLKIPIVDPAKLSAVKVRYSPNQAIVEGIPSPEDQHIVKLPALVRKKGASKEYRDQILQIKLPKAKTASYTEILIEDEE
ncbi:Hsp20/alpha crystallin family protein [Ectobacillus ponti]|uniref:Molecular chaperone n=1 Tax=Ectobacillus ponti TaxID=2961894 RepID=A0AA42BMU4_9BACI|nr:hypothetical protein [Ectobacillus ponti]MCP8967225.1 hypothetical protein [Ectobacillus ponti]